MLDWYITDGEVHCKSFEGALDLQICSQDLEVVILLSLGHPDSWFDIQILAIRGRNFGCNPSSQTMMISAENAHSIGITL